MLHYSLPLLLFLQPNLCVCVCGYRFKETCIEIKRRYTLGFIIQTSFLWFGYFSLYMLHGCCLYFWQLKTNQSKFYHPILDSLSICFVCSKDSLVEKQTKNNYRRLRRYNHDWKKILKYFPRFYSLEIHEFSRIL